MQTGLLVVPTWDLIIVGSFIFFVAYTLILQKEKILTSLVAVYIASAVTQVWGDKVAAFFMGQNFIGSFFIKANFEPVWIKIIVFFLILIFFVMKSDLEVSMQKDSNASLVLNILYSLSYAALLTASILNLLPSPTLTNLVLQSKLANFIYNHISWWVILPVVLIILGGYWNREKRD